MIVPWPVAPKVERNIRRINPDFVDLEVREISSIWGLEQRGLTGVAYTVPRIPHA